MKRRHLPTLGVVAISLIAATALIKATSRECVAPEVRQGLSCVSVSPPDPDPPVPLPPVPTPPVPTPVSGAELEGRFSSGDRLLFTDETNPDSQAGAAAIAGGDYAQAITHFENAVSSGRNEPEPQIYLNNAIAQQQGNPYTIAVVVPVDNRRKAAQEILRGVADAQTQFNDGGSERLLEVMIVNDGNEPAIAAQVAEQLSAMPEVLGVIGHNSSSASLEAFPKYEKAGLSMISPTSTSTALGSGVFFRTVPNDTETGKQLAEYATEQLSAEKVAIFYDSNSSYSRSLRDAFKANFDGEALLEVDMYPDGLSYEEAISEIPDDVSALLLFPSTGTVSRAIGIATANFNQPESDRFQLLGGDSLYQGTTLTKGGAAVEGLVLAVPWFANTPYAEAANNRWGGRVNWRTASSYDATKALSEALSQDATRDSVLSALRATDLGADETSGSALTFEGRGDRAEKPLLVQAIQGGNSPDGSKFGFELIE